MKAYLIVTSLLLGFVALVHLVRVVQGWPIVVDQMSVPIWMSLVGTVLGISLAAWGCSLLSRKT